MNYPIRVSITGDDAAEFAALPDAVKWEVLDLIEVVKSASTAARPRAALMEAAALNAHKGRGWSMKSLERKFYALRDTRDWRCLVDRAKAGGGARSEWVTEGVVEAWKRYCDAAMRSYKSAWLRMVADYRKGLPIGDVDWRRVWRASPNLEGQPMPATCPPNMPIPPGWSYYNLMRRQPKLVERLAARQGRHAAKKASALVHTTRAGMPVGSQYEFDDMWHNATVVYPGFPKAVRPMELACIDIASAHKVAYGLKPRLEDATGKRQNLAERDMRFLVAHVLCNIGFHKDGCTLFVEGGTAAIRGRLERVLDEISGGKIKVSRSGVDRLVMLGKWGFDTKGNPDHKAHVESWHNLAQNRLDALPGYTGSNSRLDKPEDHEALMRIVDKTLAAQCCLPPELAEKLRFPVLDWGTFEQVVSEIYEQISWSNDHQLEGWEDRTCRQWRAHPADIWHSEEEFLSLPDEAQTALRPLVQRDGFSRIAKMSRRQAWESGANGLVRLPDFAAAMICGEDLSVERECPPAEIAFQDREIAAQTLVYRVSSCEDAAGQPVALVEGRVYLWLINPFDYSVVFVSDTSGRYVGKCRRLEQVSRIDTDAVGREIGRARKELDEALQPLQRRGVAAARAVVEQLDSNARVLREGRGVLDTETAERKAIAADRKEAARGVSLADLACAAGTRNEAEDMDGVQSEVSFSDLM